MSGRKHYFTILAAILFALAQATAWAQLAPATTKGGVSIQLPKGWVPGNSGRSLIAAKVPQPDKEGPGQFPATIIISQDAATGPVDVAAQQRRLAQEYPDYQSVEAPSSENINGNACTRFGGKFTSNGVQLRTRQYMFSVNNQVYTVTVTCLSSRWSAYQPIVEASVATFAVKH